jgi:hypothetical protein
VPLVIFMLSYTSGHEQREKGLGEVVEVPGVIFSDADHVLPFSPCGRRGWGMRGKDWSVNQGILGRQLEAPIDHGLSAGRRTIATGENLANEQTLSL